MRVHDVALTTTVNIEGSILFLRYDNFLWPNILLTIGPYG